MDLISVLLITYVLGGETHEEEIAMSPAACTAAGVGIPSAIARGKGPTRTFLDGSKTKITSATCIHGCPSDAMADNWGLKPLMEAEGS